MYHRRHQLRVGIFDRLILRCDHGVDAVASVGNGFHHRVVQIPTTKTEHGQGDARFSLLFDQTDKLFVCIRSDVEIAIGAHHDVVDAVFNKTGLSLLIGEGQSVSASCRATCIKAIDGVFDRFSVNHQGRLKPDRYVARIGDN